MYDAVDCQGFAGGMTLGVVQSGFRLVGKREMKGGFGVANCEANRAHLGWDWYSQVAEPNAWEPMSVPFVFGNPPCSGFSVMTDKRHRGIDAQINACMHAFARFAARCNPEIAVFESVRPAYSRGRELMQRLRGYMEEGTGHRYDLYHVMHNARQLGGAGERPRYFWVASRVPFGVEYPVVRQPLLLDIIDDLRGLAQTWLPQPYRRPATWWSAPARSPSGLVDGHVGVDSPHHRRAYDLALANGGWEQGAWQGKVAKEYYDAHGTLPESWLPYLDKLVKTDFHMGYIQLTRWDTRKPARVITGGALGLVMHPLELRTITHREAARVMGFPDDWMIQPLRRVAGLQSTWGKGISVQCGRWIGRWVRAALDGQPGSEVGDEIGERERIIWPPKQSRGAAGVVTTVAKKRLLPVIE